MGRGRIKRGGLPLLAWGVLSLPAVLLLSSCAPKAAVYYTSSLNGNLLGCDCWGYPEAGLDKRALYLRDNDRDEASLLLDAGNILEAGREPFLAGLILTTYADLGYDAVAVGTHELSEGVDILVARTAVEARPPMMAHNLLADGRPFPGAPSSVISVMRNWPLSRWRIPNGSARIWIFLPAA